MPGPLNDLRVLELAGLGPVPHAGMVLADLGADVVRVEAPRVTEIEGMKRGPGDIALRGRRLTTANLRDENERAAVLALASKADVLLEGYRPGVAERLGVGPDVCLAANPGLVYARMTGWGQEGPMAARAGHDINYLSMTGVLNAIGHDGRRPTPPLNLVGDFGGGSMLLVAGVLAALFERSKTSKGQVLDVAMVDGVSILAQMIWTMMAAGTWSLERGSNLLDSGTPFYDTYETADGKFMAVGALEPQFYKLLLEGLGLEGAGLPAQYDRAGWPLLRQRFTEAFASRTRDAWTEVFRGTDACVTPVLTFDEAKRDPHMRARSTIVEVDGISQAAPAPRFSRTPNSSPTPPPSGPVAIDSILTDWKRG